MRVTVHRESPSNCAASLTLYSRWAELAASALLAYGQPNVDALRNAGIAGALYQKAEMLVGTMRIPGKSIRVPA